MNRPSLIRRLLFGVAAFAGFAQLSFADPSDLLFTVRLTGDPNTPDVEITNNSPVLEITAFELTIGDTTKHFDSQNHTPVWTNPPGGTAVSALPAPGQRGDKILAVFSGFGPGKTAKVRLDIDRDGASPDMVENFASVLINNGSAANAIATVYAGAASASRTLADRPDNFVFRGPGRTLIVNSRTESLSEGVRGATVEVDGVKVASNAQTATIEAAHGDRVIITVPKDIYRNIHGEYFLNGGEIDPGLDLIETAAQERFTASGMSVNNIAQTGDATRYDFEILADTEVQVKWQQYYALTVKHDFTRTQSLEVIAGTPWAGPLAGRKRSAAPFAGGPHGFP